MLDTNVLPLLGTLSDPDRNYQACCEINSFQIGGLLWFKFCYRDYQESWKFGLPFMHRGMYIVISRDISQARPHLTSYAIFSIFHNILKKNYISKASKGACVE